MSHVEVKIVVPATSLAALGEFLKTVGTPVTSTGTDVAAGTVTATPEAAAEDKPRRRTRAAATPKVEAPAAEETAPAAEEAAPAVPADYYDKTVKPVLVKLSSHKNGGRDAAIALVSSYGVKNAKDIPADKLEEVLKAATESLAKLDASAPAEDDVTFE